MYVPYLSRPECFFFLLYILRIIIYFENVHFTEHPHIELVVILTWPSPHPPRKKNCMMSASLIWLKYEG